MKQIHKYTSIEIHVFAIPLEIVGKLAFLFRFAFKKRLSGPFFEEKYFLDSALLITKPPYWGDLSKYLFHLFFPKKLPKTTVCALSMACNVFRAFLRVSLIHSPIAGGFQTPIQRLVLKKKAAEEWLVDVVVYISFGKSVGDLSCKDTLQLFHAWRTLWQNVPLVVLGDGSFTPSWAVRPDPLPCWRHRWHRALQGRQGHLFHPPCRGIGLGVGPQGTSHQDPRQELDTDPLRSGGTVEQNGGKWWMKAYPQPSRLLEYLLYHTSPWILRWIFEDSLHWHLYGRNATSRGSPGLISASSKASMVVRQKGGARPPWTLALPLAGTTGPRHAMP